MALIAMAQPCRFFAATALVQLLQKGKAVYELPAMLQKLDRFGLLVIDDISYVRRSELESSVLFELICHRYERRSLLITSNQPFRDWDDIFPSSSMTVAAVDRLVHHCRIVEIGGESYRQRQAKARLATMEGSLAWQPARGGSEQPSRLRGSRCRRTLMSAGPCGRAARWGDNDGHDERQGTRSTAAKGIGG